MSTLKKKCQSYTLYQFLLIRFHILTLSQFKLEWFPEMKDGASSFQKRPIQIRDRLLLACFACVVSATATAPQLRRGKKGGRAVALAAPNQGRERAVAFALARWEEEENRSPVSHAVRRLIAISTTQFHLMHLRLFITGIFPMTKFRKGRIPGQQHINNDNSNAK